MNMTGNTIVITGGGSGIGKGLAEAFHILGNQVVIAGRRKGALEAVTAANPGMNSLHLDVSGSASIGDFVSRVYEEFPATNVLINNSGIMRAENLTGQSIEIADSEDIIATNLLGPIRLTAALLPLLRRQSRSTILMVSSGLAFIPLAMTPTYCATKAAIHSYSQSLREQLRNSTTEVLELIPPYVATDLMGVRQVPDPRAMPLGEFIAEVMQILRTQPTPAEICVERVKGFRFAEKNGQYENLFRGLNESWAGSN